MNNKEEFSLSDFCKDFGYFHIKIDKHFLENLLIKAAKNNKPHCDKEFIRKLNLKLTTKYICGTIYGWIAYDKTIPLDKLSKIIDLTDVDWNKVESNIISIKAGQSRGEIRPKFPIKIDDRLGCIVGHILGDGSIDSRFQQVFFSNSNKKLLKEFAQNMEEIFGVSPRIWMQKEPDFGNTHWDKRLNKIDELKEGRSCGLFYPSVCGLILNKIFNNFAIGKNKKMTTYITSSNKEFKKGLIRAFYDDEGSINKNGNGIRVFQDNKSILNSFRKLLKELYIKPGKIRVYVKRNKNRYYFDIHRKSNFIKFRENIGFTSKIKKNRLEKAVIIKNLKNSK